MSSFSLGSRPLSGGPSPFFEVMSLQHSRSVTAPVVIFEMVTDIVTMASTLGLAGMGVTVVWRRVLEAGVPISRVLVDLEVSKYLPSATPKMLLSRQKSL